MTTETNSKRRSVFPYLAAFILLGTFAVLLTVMLNEANLVHQTQNAFPQPTTIPATEVAAAVIEETAQPEAVTEVTEAAAEVAQAEAVSFDPAVVAAGQTNFTLCTACHGLNGQGVPGLGKDLVHSEFVHSLTDEELHQFIVEGRGLSDPLNTTGMVMPPRGGNPSMTDEQIDTIVVYMRSLAADAGVGAAKPTDETSAAAVPMDAAPAPTRDPSIVAAPWTAPVPVSDTYIAVEEMPADTQALYRWLSDSSAEPPINIDLIDPSLLLPENQAALIDYLTNETGYLDSRGLYPRPADGRAMGE